MMSLHKFKNHKIFWVLLLLVCCKPEQDFASGVPNQTIGSYSAIDEQPVESPEVSADVIDNGFGDQGEPSQPLNIPIGDIALPPEPTPEPLPPEPTPEPLSPVTTIVPTATPVPTPKRQFSFVARVDAPFSGGALTSIPSTLSCNKTSVSKCSAQFDEGTTVQLFMPTKIFVANLLGRSGFLNYTGFWWCNGQRIGGVLTSRGASLTIKMDRNWSCGALHNF